MARRPKRRVVSKAEQKSARRVAANTPDEQPIVVAEKPKAAGPKRTVEIPRVVVVRDLADRLGVQVGKIMGELMKNGIMATLNDSVDFETAAIIADELGIELVEERKEEAKEDELNELEAELVARPPVVTVMGHVDHGKTRLLDAIRETDVVAQESGGITQHIGAYQVKIKNRPVTFLDTPGHEAFAALRAHGANVTDIVILVVAATEGVRPQTIEALSHAKAANVPIIVALTKIDLPETNLDRAKKELSGHGLIPEEWGGKTPMIAVSAKTGENVDQLLDMILLIADLAELKAVVNRRALGVVIEAQLRPGLGPIATVLVQEGKLQVGDPLTVGVTYGKVRVMTDWRGKKLAVGLPGMPVQIAGLHEVPVFGDRFRVVTDEKTARALVQTKSAVRHALSLGRLSMAIKEGTVKELPIVIKADVPGSLAAIQTSLSNLNSDEVAVNFVHLGIGPVSDSDINLASAANALVIAFRVSVLPSAKRLSESQGVEISTYEIIYQLIDEVAAALSGLLAPEIVEIELGKMVVLKVFKTDKRSAIVGGRVTSGAMSRAGFLRVMRGKTLIGDGKVDSLQRGKESVAEVAKGFECGLGIEGVGDLAEGDEVMAFRTEERTRRIETSK